MNESHVVFKGTQSGIVVFLDQHASFEDIKIQLSKAALDKKKFFGNASANIIFKGRSLSSQEEKTLLAIINEHTNLRISFIPIEDYKKTTVPKIKNAKRTSVLEKKNVEKQNLEKQTLKKQSLEKKNALPEKNNWAETGEKDDLPLSDLNEKDDLPLSDLNEKDDLPLSDLNEKDNLPLSDLNEKDNLPLSDLLSDLNEKDDLPDISHILGGTTNLPNIPNILDGTTNFLEAAAVTKSMPLVSAGHNETFFHRGSLRSGQSINYEGSVVITGNVNPGAMIKAHGNIVVLGSLRGVVHAGYTGNRDCFVAAIDFSPTQICISDLITYIPDDKKKQKQKNASIAYIEDKKIYIAPL